MSVSSHDWIKRYGLSEFKELLDSQFYTGTITAVNASYNKGSVILDQGLLALSNIDIFFHVPTDTGVNTSQGGYAFSIGDRVLVYKLGEVYKIIGFLDGLRAYSKAKLLFTGTGWCSGVVYNSTTEEIFWLERDMRRIGKSDLSGAVKTYWTPKNSSDDNILLNWDYPQFHLFGLDIDLNSGDLIFNGRFPAGFLHSIFKGTFKSNPVNSSFLSYTGNSPLFRFNNSNSKLYYINEVVSSGDKEMKRKPISGAVESNIIIDDPDFGNVVWFDFDESTDTIYSLYNYSDSNPDLPLGYKIGKYIWGGTFESDAFDWSDATFTPTGICFNPVNGWIYYIKNGSIFKRQFGNSEVLVTNYPYGAATNIRCFNGDIFITTINGEIIRLQDN